MQGGKLERIRTVNWASWYFMVNKKQRKDDELEKEGREDA